MSEGLLALVVCGTLAIGVGVNDARDTYRLERYGVMTTATVVGVTDGRGAAIEAAYEVDGEQVLGYTSRFHEPLEVGDVVRVEYDSTAPERFQTALWEEWETPYLWARVWGAIGAVLLLAATAIATARLRKR